MIIIEFFNEKEPSLRVEMPEDGEVRFMGEDGVEVEIDAPLIAPLLASIKHLKEASGNTLKLLPFKSCSRFQVQECPKEYMDYKGQKLMQSTDGSGGGDIPKMNARKLVDLYNIHALANGWQRCMALGPELRSKLNMAIRTLPQAPQWDIVFKGWLAHPFFSGSSGQYDRIKIRTMLFKNRYQEFYEDGLALEEQGGVPVPRVDSILSEFDELLKGVEV